jgi:uncharacterized protein YeaO (DUF488 family)
MPSRVRLRRVYDPPDAADGTRVLVDRLWPRGLTRSVAHLDEWLKDVAPTTELRRWFGHDPARFLEFSQRYHRELAALPARDAWLTLWRLTRQTPVTLLTATTDLTNSHARVLADMLNRSSPDTDDGDPDDDLGGDPACWLARVCPACGRLADRDPPTTCSRCGADLPAG